MKVWPRTLPGIIFIMLTVTGCVSTYSEDVEKWEPERRAETHVQLGKIYLRENQFAIAEKEFDAAIAINPNSDTAYHAKALLFSRIGQKDKATEYFSRSVALNPDNFLVVNDFSINLCQQGNSEEGIKHLSKVIDKVDNDQSLGSQLGLGICYSLAGRYDLSERYLRFVLNRAPGLPQALLPMADLSFQNKKYLSARAFMERYFGVGAMSARSLFLAAKIEFALDDMIKAHQYHSALQNRYPASALNMELDTLLGES